MGAASKAMMSHAGAHLRLVSDRAATSTAGIKLSGVSKTYRSRDGDVPSLRPLDFHINDGEFFVVVGPSGCGKSTLLKMISGLLPPSTERPGAIAAIYDVPLPRPRSLDAMADPLFTELVQRIRKHFFTQGALD
jgi:ABC-type nitrate/sulfonate/bicarbonate transport system ATPase subunit